MANIYYGTLSTEPEQVFKDGARLTQVDTKTSMSAGTWFWDGPNTRVYVYDDPAGHTIEAGQRYMAIGATGKSYVTLDGLTARHGNAAGIDLTTNDNHWIVQNCLVEYNYTWGTVNDSDATKNTGNTFRNNEVCYNGAEGLISMDYCESTLVSGNIVHHNGILSDQNWTAGVKANATQVVNYVVEYNHIYSNGLAGMSNSGSGIWSDTCGAGHVFRYNLIHDNHMCGILVECMSGAAVYGNVVYGTTGGAGGSCPGIEIAGRSVDTAAANYNLIYNNTCYGNDIGIRVMGISGQNASVVGNVVKNNIASGNTDHELSAVLGGENDGVLGSGNVYEYNCLGVESGTFVEWGDYVQKGTYDEWEAAYGGTTHSIEADPLFTNAAGGDFTLQVGSPCIDAGANLGTDYQMALAPGSTWP
jgi:hypothetical protein